MIKVLSFVFLFSVIFGKVVEISDLKYSATIERDEWGVPHIYGNRDSDVSFGLAYAHSQDDFKAIRDIILASRAKLASVYGKDAAANDYYVHLMGFWENIDENYENKVPQDVKNICDGYAAGINYYL